MRTYAEYLNTMTVKTLHSIARNTVTADGKLLKGYSKLRKADLIIMLNNAVAALVPVILSTEVAADAPAIVKVMAEVAPVTFSATPVASAESAVETPESVQVQESDTSELVYAYRAMRATIRGMGNTPLRVKIVGRLRTLSAQLRAMGMVPAAL